MDLQDQPVIDGHCHPLLADPWTVGRHRLLDLLTEGRPGTMHAHVPHTGYFRRVVGELARRHGVAPTVEAVLAARRAAGAGDARAMLSAARVEALLVDTGYPPTAMSLDQMRAELPCAVHEVFRIEPCAERLIGQGWPLEKFRRAFEDEVAAAGERCVAFKTIVAYRAGLAVTPWPTDAVAHAYDAAVKRARAGRVRLTDKPLLDTYVNSRSEAERHNSLTWFYKVSNLRERMRPRPESERVLFTGTHRNLDSGHTSLQLEDFDLV